MPRRLIKREEQGPQEMEINGAKVWVCMCGRTKNWPFCDGSHMSTVDEKDLPEGYFYFYTDEGKRIVVKLVEVPEEEISGEE